MQRSEPVYHIRNVKKGGSDLIKLVKQHLKSVVSVLNSHEYTLNLIGKYYYSIFIKWNLNNAIVDNVRKAVTKELSTEKYSLLVEELLQWQIYNLKKLQQEAQRQNFINTSLLSSCEKALNAIQKMQQEKIHDSCSNKVQQIESTKTPNVDDTFEKEKSPGEEEEDEKKKKKNEGSKKKGTDSEDGKATEEKEKKKIENEKRTIKCLEQQKQNCDHHLDASLNSKKDETEHLINITKHGNIDEKEQTETNNKNCLSVHDNKAIARCEKKISKYQAKSIGLNRTSSNRRKTRIYILNTRNQNKCSQLNTSLNIMNAKMMKNRLKRKGIKVILTKLLQKKNWGRKKRCAKNKMIQSQIQMKREEEEEEEEEKETIQNERQMETELEIRKESQVEMDVNNESQAEIEKGMDIEKENRKEVKEMEELQEIEQKENSENEQITSLGRGREKRYIIRKGRKRKKTRGRGRGTVKRQGYSRIGRKKKKIEENVSRPINSIEKKTTPLYASCKKNKNFYGIKKYNRNTIIESSLPLFSSLSEMCYCTTDDKPRNVTCSVANTLNVVKESFYDYVSIDENNKEYIQDDMFHLEELGDNYPKNTLTCVSDELRIYIKKKYIPEELRSKENIKLILHFKSKKNYANTNNYSSSSSDDDDDNDENEKEEKGKAVENDNDNNKYKNSGIISEGNERNIDMYNHLEFMQVKDVYEKEQLMIYVENFIRTQLFLYENIEIIENYGSINTPNPNNKCSQNYNMSQYKTDDNNSNNNQNVNCQSLTYLHIYFRKVAQQLIFWKLYKHKIKQFLKTIKTYFPIKSLIKKCKTEKKVDPIHFILSFATYIKHKIEAEKVEWNQCLRSWKGKGNAILEAVWDLEETEKKETKNESEKEKEKKKGSEKKNGQIKKSKSDNGSTEERQNGEQESKKEMKINDENVSQGKANSARERNRNRENERVREGKSKSEEKKTEAHISEDKYSDVYGSDSENGSDSANENCSKNGSDSENENCSKNESYSKNGSDSANENCRKNESYSKNETDSENENDSENETDSENENESKYEQQLLLRRYFFNILNYIIEWKCNFENEQKNSKRGDKQSWSYAVVKHYKKTNKIKMKKEKHSIPLYEQLLMKNPNYFKVKNCSEEDLYAKMKKKQNIKEGKEEDEPNMQKGQESEEKETEKSEKEKKLEENKKGNKKENTKKKWKEEIEKPCPVYHMNIQAKMLSFRKSKNEMTLKYYFKQKRFKEYCKVYSEKSIKKKGMDFLFSFFKLRNSSVNLTMAKHARAFNVHHRVWELEIQEKELERRINFLKSLNAEKAKNEETSHQEKINSKLNGQLFENGQKDNKEKKTETNKEKTQEDDKSLIDIFEWGILPVRAADHPDQVVPVPTGYLYNRNPLASLDVLNFNTSEINITCNENRSNETNSNNRNKTKTGSGNIHSAEENILNNKQKSNEEAEKEYMNANNFNWIGPPVNWEQKCIKALADIKKKKCFEKMKTYPFMWTMPDIGRFPFSLESMVNYENKNLLVNNPTPYIETEKENTHKRQNTNDKEDYTNIFRDDTSEKEENEKEEKEKEEEEETDDEDDEEDDDDDEDNEENDDDEDNEKDDDDNEDDEKEDDDDENNEKEDDDDEDNEKEDDDDEDNEKEDDNEDNEKEDDDEDNEEEDDDDDEDEEQHHFGKKEEYLHSFCTSLDDINTHHSTQNTDKNISEETPRMLEEIMDDIYRYYWTKDEIRTFLEKFFIYPKNFERIKQFLEFKSVKQCQDLYFMSKHFFNLKKNLDIINASKFKRLRKIPTDEKTMKQEKEEIINKLMNKIETYYEKTTMEKLLNLPFIGLNIKQFFNKYFEKMSTDPEMIEQIEPKQNKHNSEEVLKQIYNLTNVHCGYFLPKEFKYVINQGGKLVVITKDNASMYEGCPADIVGIDCLKVFSSERTKENMLKIDRNQNALMPANNNNIIYGKGKGKGKGKVKGKAKSRENENERGIAVEVTAVTTTAAETTTETTAETKTKSDDVLPLNTQDISRTDKHSVATTNENGPLIVDMVNKSINNVKNLFNEEKNVSLCETEKSEPMRYNTREYISIREKEQEHKEQEQSEKEEMETEGKEDEEQEEKEDRDEEIKEDGEEEKEDEDEEENPEETNDNDISKFMRPVQVSYKEGKGECHQFTVRASELLKACGIKTSDTMWEEDISKKESVTPDKKTESSEKEKEELEKGKGDKKRNTEEETEDTKKENIPYDKHTEEKQLFLGCVKYCYDIERERKLLQNKKRNKYRQMRKGKTYIYTPRTSNKKMELTIPYDINIEDSGRGKRIKNKTEKAKESELFYSKKNKKKEIIIDDEKETLLEKETETKKRKWVRRYNKVGKTNATVNSESMKTEIKERIRNVQNDQETGDEPNVEETLQTGAIEKEQLIENEIPRQIEKEKTSTVNRGRKRKNAEIYSDNTQNNTDNTMKENKKSKPRKTRRSKKEIDHPQEEITHLIESVVTKEETGEQIDGISTDENVLSENVLNENTNKIPEYSTSEIEKQLEEKKRRGWTKRKNKKNEVQFNILDEPKETILMENENKSLATELQGTEQADKEKQINTKKESDKENMLNKGGLFDEGKGIGNQSSETNTYPWEKATKKFKGTNFADIDTSYNSKCLVGLFQNSFEKTKEGTANTLALSDAMLSADTGNTDKEVQTNTMQKKRRGKKKVNNTPDPNNEAADDGYVRNNQYYKCYHNKVPQDTREYILDKNTFSPCIYNNNKDPQDKVVCVDNKENTTVISHYDEAITNPVINGYNLQQGAFVGSQNIKPMRDNQTNQNIGIYPNESLMMLTQQMEQREENIPGILETTAVHNKTEEEEEEEEEEEVEEEEEEEEKKKQVTKPQRKAATKWTDEERTIFFDLLETVGRDWNTIYAALEPYGKTLRQIKNFYQNAITKKKREMVQQQVAQENEGNAK